MPPPKKNPNPNFFPPNKEELTSNNLQRPNRFLTKNLP